MSLNKLTSTKELVQLLSLLHYYATVLSLSACRVTSQCHCLCCHCCTIRLRHWPYPLPLCHCQALPLSMSMHAQGRSMSHHFIVVIIFAACSPDLLWPLGQGTLTVAWHYPFNFCRIGASMLSAFKLRDDFWIQVNRACNAPVVAVGSK